MTCHRAVKAEAQAIARLAQMPKDEVVVPQTRIYRVPDFVFFSHALHTSAGTACETCHGTVAAEDKVEKRVTLNMKFCVDCHKVRSATIACNACHELNQ